MSSTSTTPTLLPTPTQTFSPTANLFTCTFCYNLHPEPANTLGHSARLTCDRCYTSILNLSICWVCGEIIFRREECVSLGWCFWHRFCYGCLLYGSKLVYRGVKIRELYRIKGGEIDEVPLCRGCVRGVEGERLEEEEVLARGFRRVDVIDGGVTRERLKRSWEVDRGTNEGEPTIWVDISDPINKPSFRPSPLKPLPSFLQGPSLTEGPPGQSTLSLNRPHSGKLGETNLSVPSNPEDASAADHFRPLLLQKTSFVAEEPLKHPSFRLKVNRKRSSTLRSAAPKQSPEHVEELLDSSVRSYNPGISTAPQSYQHHTPLRSSEYLELYQPATNLPTSGRGKRTVTRRSISKSCGIN